MFYYKKFLYLALKKMDTPPQFQYTTLGLIGEGATGKVYKGFYRKLGKVCFVAIKQTRNNSHSQREVEIMEKLGVNPNICHFLNKWIDGKDKLYIVMELVDGENLRQYLEHFDPHKEINFRAVLQILFQIFSGIAHLHANSIYHGDIKPGNIMIVDHGDGNFTVKIIDFGLSINFEAISKEYRGSPLYFSPEIARVDFIDHTSDIWSAGLIIIYFLTGYEMPWFMKDAMNAADIIKILKSLDYVTHPFPRELFEHHDPTFVFLAKIAERCLALDKFERPTAQEIVMEMKGKLAELDDK